MTISIIIPQHGNSNLTIDAIRSFQQHHSLNEEDTPHLEIVVIDDGSLREDRSKLQAVQLPHVTIHPLTKRRGVTAAWNHGIQHSTGDTLVFLNNDVVTHGPWLDGLIAPLNLHSNGSRPVAVGIEQRRENDFPRPLKSIAPTERLLCGWCFATSRETLKSTGGFDERFELYYSDTDWMCRLLQKTQTSFSLQCVPDLPLKHLGHASTRHLSQRSECWQRDRARFLKKWNA